MEGGEVWAKLPPSALVALVEVGPRLYFRVSQFELEGALA